MKIILLTVIFSTFNFTGGAQLLPLVAEFEGRLSLTVENKFSGDSVTGEISDSHCLFNHMDGMKSDADCINHCRLGEAKAVLIERVNNRVFALDPEGEIQAAKFAARRVRIFGHVMEKMIHVERIDAAE